MNRLLIFILLLLCASARATVIYVSNSGSDANNGTTKLTAFAHTPGGQQFTGSYSHSSTNDWFIYRGGDTWGSNEFGINAGNGGLNSTWMDYYGVDKTWYSGVSWVRPIWTGQSNLFKVPGEFIYLGGGNNVIIDNIEMCSNYWNSANQAFGLSDINVGAATNIQIINCYLHSWFHDTAANGCSDNLDLILGSTTGVNASCYTSNCIIDGAPGGTDSGAATYCFPCAYALTARNMRSGPLPNGYPCILSNFTIGPLNTSFSGTHGAGFEPVGSVSNVVCAKGTFTGCQEVACQLIGGNGVQLGDAYAYDIIISNGPVGFLNKWISGSSNSAHIWNSVVDVSSAPNYAVLTESGTLSYLDVQNVLAIGVTNFTTSATNGNIDHNLFWSSSTATGNGFTAGNLYYNGGNSAAVSGGTSAPSWFFSTDFNGATFTNWYIGPYAYASLTHLSVALTGGGTTRVIGGGTTLLKR